MPLSHHTPLDLNIIAFGAPDKAALLLLVKALKGAFASSLSLAEQTAQQAPLKENVCRVAFFSEDDETTKRSLDLLETFLEKGTGAPRLEAQGIFYREGPPLSQDAVAFMFPGQGSQYVGMLDELKARYPIVEETLQEADAAMAHVLPKKLSSYLTRAKETDEAEAFFALSQTEVLQPAILAADEAIRRLLSPLLIPKIVFGHSLGEYGACVAAGVMSLPDALRIVAAREGALAKVTIPDNGKMLAVGASEEVVARHVEGIQGYVVVVNKNCPSQTIIGGESLAVEEAEQRLQKAGLDGVYLPVSHAFHSNIVAPACEPLYGELGKIPIHAPHTQILSDVTADFYPTDPGAPEWIRRTLAKQMASPVEFIRVVERAYQAGARIFVEVGPKRAQSGFVSDILKGRPHRSLYVCHPKQGELVSFGRAVASLCAEGVIQYGRVPQKEAIPKTPQEPSVDTQRDSLPEPFFVRRLSLELAPPRGNLPLSIDPSRALVLYSPGAEPLLQHFPGRSLLITDELSWETFKDFSFEVLIDLCLFGDAPLDSVMSAALFQTRRVLRLAKGLQHTKPKRIVVYTPMGGALGAPGTTDASEALLAASGAGIGAWKSVAREWYGEALHWYPLTIVDLPQKPSFALWREATQEVHSASPLEVGLQESPVGIIRRAPVFRRGVHDERHMLSSDSVVLLLGGGRGITAKIAQQLSARYHCRLALLGRTQSQPETPAFDRARALFAAKEQLGPQASRAQLQQRAEELLRQRELSQTLSQLKAQGASFFYLQGDARHPSRVAAAIEETRRRYGRVDVIVHGAGVDRSRSLTTKPESDLEEVLAPFLRGEVVRLAKEAKASLVVLGSLSARFGNFGQLDYGAAHEALAKIALSSGALVLDFTAWSEVGMAASLSSTFKERGIDLLPPMLGANAAVDAIHYGLTGEWVISGKLPQPALGGSLLQGEAQCFIPWTELHQRGVVAPNLSEEAATQMAKEAAQSIFPPLQVSSIEVTPLSSIEAGALEIYAERGRTSAEGVWVEVFFVQKERAVFRARVRLG